MSQFNIDNEPQNRRIATHEGGWFAPWLLLTCAAVACGVAIGSQVS